MRKFLRSLMYLSMAAGASAGASATAIKTDWRIVNWNEDVLLYVDHGSIQKSKGRVAYSAKIVFLKDASLSEVLSRVQVHCDDRMYRNVAISAVSKAGRAQVEKASRTWRAVEAGTNVEREMLSVCS